MITDPEDRYKAGARDKSALFKDTAQMIDAKKGLEDLAKRHSEDMEEGEVLMFPGAINNERQNRVATAMQRGGAAALGLAGACFFAGIALLPLEMEALAQVGLSILCLGFSIPPAIGCLSLFLLLGLGDSKARRKAFKELGRYAWSRLSGQVHGEGLGVLDGRSKEEKARAMASQRRTLSNGSKAFDDLETKSSSTAATLARSRGADDSQTVKPHMVAAMTLGAPMGIASGETWNKKRENKAKAQREKDALKEAADYDVGSEAGPCILTLDVQGATAKPPYHIVMATRDVINVEG
jgi:hypothetical protein